VRHRRRELDCNHPGNDRRRNELDARAGDAESNRLDLLWKSYKETESADAQEQLVAHYLPLVRTLAVGISRKLAAGADLEELTADGSVGLLRAVEAFDPSRGFKFETYAIPVIRGSIFNGVRRLDWVPERTRTKARALQHAMERLQSESGQEPTREDLAAELKISTDEVYDLISSLSTAYLLSLDQPIGHAEEGDSSYGDYVEDQSTTPLMEVEFAEERQQLRDAIGKLDEREQMIVTLHYFEGVTFDAISRELGVSKQRVSQLHSRAVKTLRQFLGDEPISSEAVQSFSYEA
jgi:RNA polymerase sigma factor for flagellar operon FliA